MILKDATFEAYGYEIWELKPYSRKLILAACELCGNFSVTKRAGYHTFCHSCSHILGETMKGNTHALGYKHTDEQNLKKSIRMTGIKRTEEEKAKLSASVKGENNHNYKGGRRIAKARDYSKRKRQLGYTLLLPLKKGEVGHHITNEHVIGILKKAHESCGAGSGGRERHRAKVLEWLKVNDTKKYHLVLLVLANHD